MTNSKTNVPVPSTRHTRARQVSQLIRILSELCTNELNARRVHQTCTSTSSRGADWRSARLVPDAIAVADQGCRLIQQVFEYVGQEYSEIFQPKIYGRCMQAAGSMMGGPHAFAPPMLQHKDAFLFQTPNILSYLGEQFHLAGTEAMHKYYVWASSQPIYMNRSG